MSGSVGTPAPVKAGTAVSPSATPVAMPPISSIAPAHASGAATQSRLEASDAPTLAAELERGAGLLDALCEQLVHSPGTPRPVLIRVDGIDPGAVADVGEALRRLG